MEQDIPPEPGETPDPCRGATGTFREPPEEENSPADVEVNEEDEEDA